MAVTATEAAHVPLTLPTRAGTVAGVTVPKFSVVPLFPQLGVPPQVVVKLGVAATCAPVGKLSTKEIPVKGDGRLLVFVIVKVSVEAPFFAIGLGENDFVIVGGSGTPQPVMIISSSSAFAPGVPLLRPTGIMRNVVDVVPVVAAVIGPKEFHWLLATAVLEKIGAVAAVNAAPLAVENTYMPLLLGLAHPVCIYDLNEIWTLVYLLVSTVN